MFVAIKICLELRQIIASKKLSRMKNDHMSTIGATGQFKTVLALCDCVGAAFLMICVIYKKICFNELNEHEEFVFIDRASETI